MAKEPFPKTVKLSGTDFAFRLMTAHDRAAILKMAVQLEEADLYFMRGDITQPEMVDEWVDDVESGRALTILVEDRGKIVAYGTLHYNQIYWNRHLAEVRIMVSSGYRNRSLGTEITNELMRLAKERKFDKVLSFMAAEDKGAQKMLEGAGFRAEALLSDWIKTRDNQTHDLVIMSVSLK